MELNLAQIARWTEGEILQGSPQLKFNFYNFDSRLTQRSELFFALKGQRDGHDFVLDAYKKGAGGAVVSRPIFGLPSDFALVKVKDTLLALQALAHQVLLSSKAKIVAITGSVGKTTTKELTAAMLASRYRVLKSEKNYNNEIGLPLTLLRLSPQDEIVVVEMAMRGPGQIKKLTEIAPPDVAVLTGIHPVHLEFFPSMEELAKAKQEILLGTKREGVAILNGDDEWVMKMAAIWSGKRFLFGFADYCQLKAKRIPHLDFNGLKVEVEFKGHNFNLRFPFFYESSLYNLLAAWSVAQLFSIPADEIIRVAESAHPEPGRGQLFHLDPDIKLIDDTYNSNPYALKEALRSLGKLPAKRRLAVLGDMLELGPQASFFHREVGKKLVEYNWHLLFTVGELSLEIAAGAKEAGLSQTSISSFKDSLLAAEALDKILEPGDLVLVKGSRAMKMEKVVDYLKAKRGGQ
ncbi:MAG: UDP-N-acetylmuramoyl-tripeptide--D-alanyl-D-alanine ligase [Candidatus Aminicenantes bacterium]|nr:UDP-N-acetylmuramoyl-tripeptide--D-alanyl-D-alanine ligase [Candidatus Aminicenantes bacterium]